MAANGNLSTKQQRAIVALLGSSSVQEAAKTARVGERTLHRWLKENRAFQQALAAAEAEAIAQAGRQLAGAAGESAAALIAILQDKEAKDRDKISAALGLLSNLPKVREWSSLEAKLLELERRLADVNSNDG
jgi:hypothetical protein